MYAAVNGYYNGSQIVLEEDVEMQEGQKVIVTVLDYHKKITREKGKKAFHAIREQLSDVPEMSLDEINAEIKVAREERRTRV